MNKTIRIGTRDSQLALWQANYIATQLKDQGFTIEIIHIKSAGEYNTTTPLYEMGVQGIFTKALDLALLNDAIDIAVHSLKDVPTQLPKGLIMACTPKRGPIADYLITKDPFVVQSKMTIATSSLRRKAQWLLKYPNHTVVDIRGNVNTRLEKLKQNTTWHGTIMAKAGVERIALQVPYKKVLDWMLPAPAQGALGVVCREQDTFCLEACRTFHDVLTEQCITAERDLLRTLMGGCTLPIGALATIDDQTIRLEAILCDDQGQQSITFAHACSIENYQTLGKIVGTHILENGGQNIVDAFKN